jgi:hypothetical protein
MSLDQDTLPERYEIEDETDHDTLRQWHTDAVDLFERIKAQIAAHNLFDDHDDDEIEWAHRAKHKAGYAGTALRRIERRMVAVGLELPLTVQRKERQRIVFLEGLADFLQRTCDEAGIEHGTAPIVRTKGEDR